jgi:hypothetical protein
LLLLNSQQKLQEDGIIITKFIVLAFTALVVCTCTVMADPGVPQVPETQGFVTSTAMSAIGTVTETDSIVNIIAGFTVDPPGTIPYPVGNNPGPTEYTSTYSENTIADQGLVTYTKNMATDTTGIAAANLYNVGTSRVVEFIGGDTGRMTSDETTVLDGAGSWLYDQYILTCPFASDRSYINPAFCNIVQEGSSVDLTLGSLSTDTEQRYIMQIAKHYAPYDLPVSDPGVESDYAIKLTGFGDVPAMGSATAFINVHAQEARTQSNEEELIANPKAEDLVYSETTTASGDITLFQKVMGYSSKITAPGVYTQPIK